MNLFQNLGYLALGSRLRRLSESFIAEINRSYQDQGINFDASWFPVFYLLSKNDALSIRELSKQTEVSHPAASQLVTNLKKRGLVTSATCTDDGRRQLVTLTDDGRKLLKQVMPVWVAVIAAMNELTAAERGCDSLLPAITALEKTFKKNSLAEAIGKHLPETSKQSSK